MTEASNSGIEAAVSAIMRRDRPAPASAPRPQRADLSALRRAHHEQLQSEFAKAGMDLGRLEQAYKAYRAEVDRLRPKPSPAADSKPHKPSTRDREWARNRKRAYELIAGRPLITVPVVIDAPVAIYSLPSGALIDSHIESWNSWATWHHQDDQGSEDSKQAFLRFLFAWQNETPYPVVIKSASADLATRGFCSARADPPWLDHCNAQLFLSSYHRAHVGTSETTGDDRILLNLIAHTDGWLFGGAVQIVGQDIDRTSHVSCRDVVVPGGGIAVFEVGVEAYYSIREVFTGGGEGEVHYLFAYSGRRIACPSLALEVIHIFQS